MSLAVSTSEIEQPAQRRRIFTRPAVLGGKKHATAAVSSQRQTSSNGGSVQNSTTTSPIPNSGLSFTAVVDAAVGAGQRRAATSLGHHQTTHGGNNKANSAANNHIPHHQARQTSYDYASRASILGNDALGSTSSSTFPRHSNELSARTQYQHQQQQQQHPARTSSSLDGPSHHTAPSDNNHAHQSRLHQNNPYAHHDRLVDTIVQKLVIRLPHRASENRITTLHTDEHGTRKLFSLLQQFTRHRLSYILHTLHTELEQVIKQPSLRADNASYNTFRQDPLDGLRSQALLLRMISGCLDWHADHTASPNIDPPPLDDRTAKQLVGTVTFFIRQYYASTSNSALFQDTISLKSSSYTQQPRNSESSNNLVSSVTSPPSISGRFVQEHGTPGSISSPGGAFTKRFRRTSIPTPASLLENQSTAPTFEPLLRTLKEDIQKRELNLFSDSVERKTAQDILKDCLISCSAIIRYISASRWDIIQARLRSKLSNHWSAANATSNASSPGNLTSSQEDILPDMTELHLFEFSSYNDTRLTSLLSELSLSFTTLRKSVQPVISLMLHDIIDSYTSSNPQVFHAMYEDGKRLSFAGQPEALFDAVFSVGDTIKRRNATWPTLAILLPLCPEIVMQIAMGGGDTRSPMLSKKVLFLDALRKAVRSAPSTPGKGEQIQPSHPMSQETRLALQCYTTICKSASYARPIKGRPLPPLWILANEMEAEIRKRLLDPSRPCIGADGEVDTDLIEKAIVAVGRMSPKAMFNETLPRLLSLQAPAPIQVASLRALLELLEQDGTDTTSSRGAVTMPVTRLLHQAVTSTFGSDSSGRISIHDPSSASRQIMDDVESDRNQVVLAILRLFMRNKLLLLPTHQEAQFAGSSYSSLQPLASLATYRPSDSAQILTLLACLMQQDNHRRVQSTVTDVLLFLQDRVNSRKTSNPDNTPEDIQTAKQGRSLYEHVDAITLALAQPCLTPQDSAEDDMVTLKAFVTYLHGLCKASARIQWGPEQLNLTMHLAEMVGMLQLCSASGELKALGTSVLQAAATLAAETKQANFVTNISSMSATIQQESGPVVGGHVAQMKRLMKIFRSITAFTPALMATWSELYSRWNRFGGVFGMQGFDSEADKSVGGIDMTFMQVGTPNEDSMTEWIQLSGFLVRTAALVYPPQTGTKSLKSLLPTEYLSPPMQKSEVQEQDIVGLLHGMLRLLSSDHARMRDAAREQLGNELSPELLHYIMSEISAKSEAFYNAKQLGEAHEPATLHFDQTLFILAQNTQRLGTPVTLSVFTCGHIERHLLASAYYANMLGSSSSGIRLKVKVCRAAQAVLKKRKDHATSLTSTFRNTLVTYLVAFVTEAKHSEISEKNRLELESQSLQALSACLDGLRVRRYQAKVNSGEESTDVRVLHTYTNSLLSLIPAIEVSHMKPLRTIVVTGLANLLASNYPESEPVIIRLCGAQCNLVIVNATFQKMSTIVKPATRDYFGDLVSILCSPDLSLALSVVDLCTTSDHEGILELMMQTLSANGLETKLLKALIEQEVSSTEHESTLFRGNSPATRLLTSFARSRGYSYLRFLISNLLSTLSQQPLDLSDMDMYSEADSDHEGLARLESDMRDIAPYSCVSLLRTQRQLFQLIDRLCYREMQDLCHHIQFVVREYFPDSVYTAIGGWIFLRYINPAIISPEIVDLDMPEESRKALLLISKLLQALSNNIRFKESGMKSLNGFISKVGLLKWKTLDSQLMTNHKQHILDMTSFLTQISAGTPSYEQALQYKEPRLSAFDSELLFRFIWTNTDRIGSTLLTRNATTKSRRWLSSSDNVEPGTAQLVWSNLTTILWALKQQTGDHEYTTALKANPQAAAFEDLEKVTLLPQEELNQIYRSDFKSQRGLPAFCLVLRRVSNSNTDFDALLLEAVRKWRMLQADKFDLIFDCTTFSEENSIPLKVLQAVVNHEDALHLLASLNSIYLFAPSSQFVAYFKRVIALLPGTPRLSETGSFVTEALCTVAALEGKMQIIQDIFELEDYFSAPAEALPPSTVELLSQDRAFVTDAIFVCQEGTHSPCQVRVGLHDISITSTRKRVLHGDLKTETQDFIQGIDIEGVYSKHGLYGSADFEVRLMDGSSIALLEVEEVDALGLAMQNLRSTVSTSRRLLQASNNDTVSVEVSGMAVALIAIASKHQETTAAGKQLWAHCNRLSGVDPSVALTTPSDLSPDLVSSALLESLRSRPTSLPQLVVLLLSCLQSASEVSKLQVIAFLKATLSLLADPASFAHAVHRSHVCEMIHALLEELAAASTMAYLLQTKIWPSLLKIEFILQATLERMQMMLVRVDSANEQKVLLEAVLGTAPTPVAVRSDIIRKLQQLVWKATSRDLIAIDQGEEWSEMSALLRMDAYMSEHVAATSSFYAGDLIWLYSMIAGFGNEQVHSMVWGAIEAFTRSLEVSIQPRSGPLQDEPLKTAFQSLRALQQVDVLEQLQEGYVPQVVTAIDTFVTRLITQTLEYTLSKDTGQFWASLCSGRALRCVLSASGVLQYRSLLVLSQFPVGLATFRTLLQAISTSLAENINSNTLQAHLICFAKAVKQCDSVEIAAQVFWLGVGTSQAHPLLFATSASLVESAVSCILQRLDKTSGTLEGFLLHQRNKTEDLVMAGQDLEDLLETHFTEENFSFALVSLFAKGLQQQDTYDATSSLFRSLSRCPVTSVNLDSLPKCQDIDSLGYLAALLPTLGRHDTEAKDITLTSSTTKKANIAGPYKPLLQELDVEKNEPLVLAASLTMSFLHFATDQEERVLLLNFLLEIAEISPAVILLLAEDLIPLLNTWLQESTDTTLVGVTDALLSYLLSSSPSTQLNGLDISAYGAALGLPHLLESASFFNFLTQAAHNTDLARQKLRCCADLLGAFLAAPSG